MNTSLHAMRPLGVSCAPASASLRPARALRPAPLRPARAMRSAQAC